MDVSNRNPVKKAAYIATRLEQFDPKSTQIDNYNEELRLQLNLLETAYKYKQSEIVEQIKYVQNQMK